ncbi:MAG: ABC transporter substrate-binding protein [candidate division WOR-3 bacterium]|nr:ABC transporter substrate-binding protein [Thermoproteota archaeon]
MGKYLYKTLSLAITLIFFMNIVGLINPSLSQELNRSEMLVIVSTNPITLSGVANPLAPGYVNDGNYLNLMILEPLYLFDCFSFELIPWLADGQPTWIDDYTCQIKLKRNVFWQDGTPFTAEDVIYTYSLGKRGILSATYNEINQLWLTGDLESITAPNNWTVLFNFNRNKPDPARALLRAQFARHEEVILPKHIFEQAEAEMAAQNKTIFDFRFNPPVGTGPYKLLSWSSDRAIVERWDDWWGKQYFGRLPAPKYFAFISGTSNDDAMRKLIAGDADWSTIAPQPNMEQLRSLYGIILWSKNPPYFAPGLNMIDGYGFNLPRMEQRFGREAAYAIRRAISYAIDPEKIAQLVYYGTSFPLHDPSCLPPNTVLEKFRDEELLANYTYYYNPDKAKQILSEAGIIDRDGDGIVEAPNGEPVVLTGYTVEGFSDWMANLELLASWCENIGIKIEKKAVPVPSMLRVLDAGTDFDVYAMQRHTVDSTLYYSYTAVYDYTATSWMLAWLGKTGNAMRYINQTMVELRRKLASCYSMLDPKYESEIKETCSQIQRLLCAELPVIPVVLNTNWVEYSPKYWTGWSTEDNPYPIGHPGQAKYRFLVALNVKPVGGGPVGPAIPAGLEETINATYSVVVAMQGALSSIKETLNNMMSTYTMLAYTNIALILIMIIMLVYVVLSLRKIKPEE